MNELVLERDAELLVLTLNRPDKANALNQAMHDALVSQLSAAQSDQAVRAVVLAAAGERTFSAGADLLEFAELDRASASHKRRELLARTLTAVIDFGKPLVAAVQAKALGGGCMLVLLADEVVMADTAQLQMPEIRHGFPSPMGVAVIAFRGGLRVAGQMVQTGEPVDATTARALGLANEISAVGKVRHRALERARALALLPGSAFSHNKKWINREVRAALDAAAQEAGRMHSA